MQKKGQPILVAIAAATGLGLAYVDSLPGWDDSGILAGAMLLSSGAITLAGGAPPWLVALATGMWIPAHTIVAGGDPLTAVILTFAFLGAYAGALMRAALTGTANPN